MCDFKFCANVDHFMALSMQFTIYLFLILDSFNSLGLGNLNINKNQVTILLFVYESLMQNSNVFIESLHEMFFGLPRCYSLACLVCKTALVLCKETAVTSLRLKLDPFIIYQIQYFLSLAGSLLPYYSSISIAGVINP